MSTSTIADTLVGRLEEAALDRGIAPDELLDAFTQRVGEFANEVVVERHSREYLTHIREATEAKLAAEATWRTLVVEAGLIGVPRRDIADAAQVTRQWVGQLVTNAVPSTDN